jgi:hypothetical protein
MRKILDKLTKLEISIANEKGPFDLFALVLREDGFDKWDLVVSAPWIQDNYNAALYYISKKLNSALSTDELLTISKVVLVDEFDERVRNIQKAITVEHRPTEFRDANFFGLETDLVYIITSKVQADKRLTQLIWEILTEMWKSGEREVDSGDVLKVLKKSDENIQPGAMRRVFDLLINSGCIRATKYIDRDGIREHGAMTIFWLHPHCPEIES